MGTLPKTVQEWAGLKGTVLYAYDPQVTTKPGHTRSLSVLNDKGWDFIQIAKLIEEQL